MSESLSFAGLGGVKPKQDLPAVPREAAEAGHSPPLFLLVRGLLLAGEFLPGSGQCQPGGWGDADKMKMFFQGFCAVFLRFFVTLCC